MKIDSRSKNLRSCAHKFSIVFVDVGYLIPIVYIVICLLCKNTYNYFKPRGRGHLK